jgi:nucleoside-diphosphate-sugar epimerase
VIVAKVLFIGGPGNISTSAVELLLERGFEIAIFTLPASPVGGLERRVKLYHGDRNKPEELKRALSEFRPERTADVCCFTPEQAQGLIPLLRDRVERHLFVSTVDIYGYPLTRLPFGESDPFNEPVSQYAADKLACERLFWAEHHRGSIPLSVVRPSYSFGPPFVLSFFSRRGGLELLARLRAGRPVVVPGDGQTLIHPSSAYNTGRMLAEILASPMTVGQDFTCAHPSFMSADDYYRLFAEALGVEARIVHIPKDWLLPLETSVIPDNLLSELTQFHIAFSVEKFRRYFPDFCWQKSLPQAAREYVAFHDEKGEIPEAGEGFEDRLLRAWELAGQAFRP